MSVRSANDRDRDAVLGLGVAEEAAWFGEAELSPDEVGEWVDEEGGLRSGVVAVDSNGRVRGFASPGRIASVLIVDPACTDEVADELLPWLHERRDAVRLMTFAGDTARLRAFERHGLLYSRSTFSMARSESAGPVPPAVFPGGVDVRRYRMEEADEAVHRLVCVDAAWGSVAGHTERALDAWLETQRPCRSRFLARRDGRPVGWVSGRVLGGGRGFVTTLAVAVSERGRGLGRALLLHAFADLQSSGARGLTLAVEGRNEAALGLYRSVGLEVEREWRTYATDRTRR